MEPVLLSHSFERGVLVVTVHADPGADGGTLLLTHLSDLVHAHRSAPVVVVLDDAAAVSTVIGAVLCAHRICSRLGVLMSVATASAPARRLLEAGTGAGGHRMVIHARVGTAIAIAAAFAAAA
ncbi:hypothetical protein [Streptomyces sp. NPDC006193]|uniref:hypothetical protein n=1 Tax=Streptomyces sp. NPDC006193 TaxID=3155717 RepID=UPI0033AE7507